jgi:putative acyl-CoA dehydrogenase
MCLDVLRAMARQPDTLEALRAELRTAAGADRRLDKYVAALEGDLEGRLSHGPDTLQQDARRLVERLALAVQGALLTRTAPAAVADGFCASRLGLDSCGAFGTLPSGLDLGAIIERTTPRTA